MSQPTELIVNLITTPCAESIEFYKQAFGFEELMRMPGPDGKVIHAELKLGNILLFLNDSFPDHEKGVEAPTALGGTTVILNFNVPSAGEAFERAVKAGATVAMPVEDTFWGARYGQVTCPYGHRWAFNQLTKRMTPEEMQAAMRA